MFVGLRCVWHWIFKAASIVCSPYPNLPEIRKGERKTFLSFRGQVSRRSSLAKAARKSKRELRIHLRLRLGAFAPLAFARKDVLTFVCFAMCKCATRGSEFCHRLNENNAMLSRYGGVRFILAGPA